MSVRALMVLILVLGAGMGWWVHSTRVQRDAVARIVGARGRVSYDWEVTYDPASGFHKRNPSGKPLWPRWAITWLGPDYFSGVTVVNLGPDDADAVMVSVGRLKSLGAFYAQMRGTSLTDAGLAHLRGLGALRDVSILASQELDGKCLAILKDVKSLRRVQFGNARFFVDADLAPLAELTELRTLLLRSPGIDDAGVAHLGGMVEMHALSLPFTRITAGGLERLRFMTQLESLDLNWTHVDGLAFVRHFPRLQRLSLASTPIADAALADLRGLDQLESLDLSSTQVTDAGLEHLRGLKKLRTLRVRGTEVSPGAFAALQKDLPLLAPEPAPKPALVKRAAPRPKAKVAPTPPERRPSL
jgi:hypothetical protein